MRRLSYIYSSNWPTNAESQASNSCGEDLPKDQPRSDSPVTLSAVRFTPSIIRMNKRIFSHDGGKGSHFDKPTRSASVFLGLTFRAVATATEIRESTK